MNRHRRSIRQIVTGVFLFALAHALLIGNGQLYAQGDNLIEDGQIIEDSISTAGEVDEYQFLADAGDMVTVFADEGLASGRFVTEIYTSGGKRLATSISSNGEGTIRNLTLPSDDTYTMRAFADFDGTGPYSLYFYHPSYEIVQTLVDGDSAASTIDQPGDADGFAFEGQANQPVTVYVENKTTGPAALRVTIYEPDGSSLHWTSTTGDPLLRNIVLPEDGVYTAVVRGSTLAVGDYELHLHVPSYETTSITPDTGVTQGELDLLGDADGYTFVGCDNDTIGLQLKNGQTSGSKLLRLKLLGPQGTELLNQLSAWEDDIDVADFELPANGSYTIVVEGHVDSLGAYELILTYTGDPSSCSSASQYTLTTEVAGSGAIDLSPAQATYAAGQQVTLTAQPAEEWTFSGWSGDVTGNANPLSITMDTDKQITANFSQIDAPQYTLGVETIGAGQVILSPDQVTYSEGQTVRLQAVGDNGWQFSGWSGDMTGTENPLSIVMTMDMSLTATFTLPGSDDRCEVPRWLVLVFLNGDNNLDFWTFNLVNRLEAIADNPCLAIVVLWDRSDIGDTVLYRIQPDDRLFELATYTEGVNRWEQGELNLGDPQVFVDFVEDAREDFPADYTMLSLVGHGNGWSPSLESAPRGLRFSGISFDDSSDGEYLSTSTIEESLGRISNGGANPVDLLFYDACLMAMTENLYPLRNYVDYVVASENETFTGYPYDRYLEEVDGSTTPAQLAVRIVEEYHQSVAGYPRTMTAFDSTGMEAVALAVDSLAEALLDDLTTYDDDIEAAFAATQKFDSNVDLIIDGSDAFVDLYHLAMQIDQQITDASVRAAAQAVMAAVGDGGAEGVVLAHRGKSETYRQAHWDLDNAYGLSIYLPLGGDDWALQYYDESELTFAADTNWGVLLKNLIPTPSGPENQPEVDPEDRPGPLSPTRIYLPYVTDR